MKVQRVIWLISLAIAFFGLSTNCSASGSLVTDSDKVAAAKWESRGKIVISRAADQRILSDYILMFPKELGTSPACYQAAFSSFIDNTWAEIASSTGCDSDEKLCKEEDKAAQSLDSLLALSGTRKIIFHNSFNQLDEYSKFITPLLIYLNPNAYTDTAKAAYAGSTDQVSLLLGGLNNYITQCSSLKPAQWVAVDTPIDTQHMSAYSWRLDFYTRLMQDVLSYHLSDTQKSCAADISEYVRSSTAQATNGLDCSMEKECFKQIPQDTKDSLAEQLGAQNAKNCLSAGAQ